MVTHQETGTVIWIVSEFTLWWTTWTLQTISFIYFFPGHLVIFKIFILVIVRLLIRFVIVLFVIIVIVTVIFVIVLFIVIVLFVFITVISVILVILVISTILAIYVILVIFVLSDVIAIGIPVIFNTNIIAVTIINVILNFSLFNVCVHSARTFVLNLIKDKKLVKEKVDLFCPRNGSIPGTGSQKRVWFE